MERKYYAAKIDSEVCEITLYDRPHGGEGKVYRDEPIPPRQARTSEERMAKVNAHLESIGSKFRAVTETRILMYLGHGLRWLKKDFDSIDDMEAYVYRARKEARA